MKAHVAVKNGYESAKRTSPEALFSMALSANGNILLLLLLLLLFFTLGSKDPEG